MLIANLKSVFYGPPSFKVIKIMYFTAYLIHYFYGLKTKGDHKKCTLDSEPT